MANNIITLVPKLPVPMEENLECDIARARMNILEATEIAQSGMVELGQLADQAQDSKMYDALSKMITTTVNANKELIELHRAKQDLTGQTQTVVQNNLYVGSTKDAIEMLKNRKKEETEE